ncbi:ATP-binding cassette domain-containing protein [Rhodobacteraceae bacterium B1Z28]|uniref:ATP-binding cassette domain-containing protein n=1 Tax=Ruegeria haliotis TaxID=2747601 RepID=A0ABX2PWC3_9RHOB|nr:ATP-binding cassette domain-containing protein [Ruegeria haliotis]NVO58512.1 ATP-binding cassette domain-containing protein [Ruegeria haliotis]
MTAALLELRGLTGGYPPVSVFRDVNLTIKPGEHVGFFGPNGHGKTTLLKTIAGVLDPWDGGIYFEGNRLNAEGAMQARVSHNLNYDLFRKRRIKARDVVDAGLIYVMQGNLLFPEMTVEEVLDIAPRAARGRPGVGQMRRQIHDLFPRLRERWQSKVRYLSGGERQMVSIAVGLLAMPRLLMLDEPTLGLSPKLRIELSQAVQNIRETGVPLIIVDQNVEFLTSLVDRLILFDHGTVTREIPAENMPDHAQLMEMMFGGAH